MRLFLLVGALATLCACNLLAVDGSEADPAPRNESGSNGRAERGEEKGAERSSREEEPTQNRTDRDDARRDTASDDQDWILGRWGDAACQTIVEFEPGGRMIIDGAEGQWRLDGDALTMSGGGGELVYTVSRDGGGFTIADGEGNVEQLGRC